MTSWIKMRLGEIGTLSKGVGISQNDVVEDGCIEAIRYGELYTTYGEIIDKVISRTNDNLGQLIFSEANDVIIPASGETNIDIAKASCVLRSGIALGGDLNIIRTSQNGIFLVYYLNNAARKDIARVAQGVSIVHLYGSELEKIKIMLPSVPEQQAIVDAVRDFDDYLDKVRAKLKATRQLKKGLSQQIFSGQLRFTDDNGQDFPDWEKKRLGDISDIYQPVTISQDNITYEGYLVYGANGVIGRYSDYNHEYEQIAITCRGSTCGVVNFTKPKSWITGNSMVVNLDDNKNIIKKFMYYELVSQNLKYLVGGSGIPQIIGADLKCYMVYIPSLFEQQKITEFLSSIDELINSLEKNLESAKVQKKWLLDNLVTGKIRLKEFRDE